MREIKFRAWDMINNCWINIFKFCFAQNGQIIAIESIEGETYGLHQVKVIQCIDLRDKDNNEIFKSDILQEWFLGKPIKIYWEVVVENLTCGYRPLNPECHVIEDRCFHPFYHQEDKEFCNMNRFKIIGNIYENPELLK